MKAEIIAPSVPPQPRDVTLTLTEQEAEVLAKFLGWGSHGSYKAYTDAVRSEKHRLDPSVVRRIGYQIFAALTDAGVAYE